MKAWRYIEAHHEQFGVALFVMPALLVGVAIVGRLVASGNVPPSRLAGSFPRRPAAASTGVGVIGSTLAGLFVDDHGVALATVHWGRAAWAIEWHRATVPAADALVFAAGILVLMSMSALRRTRST